MATGQVTPPSRYNDLFEVHYKGGWIGLFSGENQSKALDRALREINARGLGVAAMVVDRWSVWRRLLSFLILLVTLGFIGRAPNVIVTTEPMHREFVPPVGPNTLSLGIQSRS